MKPADLKELLDREGPLTTVCLDVTWAEPGGDREVRTRWAGLRRELESQGAPRAALEALEDAVLRPARGPHPTGRFVVAAGSQILLDQLLATPPLLDEAFHGETPSLMPAAAAAEEEVRLLLVEVDRAGADLKWSGPDRPADVPAEVEGGHDVLHKAAIGGWQGWNSRSVEARVEDSWERNAEAVAAELDRLVAAHHPDLVALTGDVRATALVRENVGRPVAELLVEVPGGSRAEGVKEEVLAERMELMLEQFRARRREQVLDRLRQGLGQGAGAVAGLEAVVEVLRRGQVSHLIVLRDGLGSPAPLAGRTLWATREALDIGLHRAELEAMGIAPDAVRRVRADAALLRAALAQDAAVTFAVPDSVELPDGVGALLRWSNAATPAG